MCNGNQSSDLGDDCVVTEVIKPPGMSNSKLTLITPTSDRPVAFELCERWMQRAMEQFDGEVQWIVSDDGNTPVTCSLGQEHIHRQHSGDKRKSFLGNLQAAFENVRHEKVLFIEDDDWYAADYLTKMSRWLDEADICGEGRARYYHLPTRRYRLCPNSDHASLCQTGIRGELVSWMSKHIAQHRSTFIDVHVWKTGAKECKRSLQPQTTLSVGIKGLPGTGGIGVGHRLDHRSRCDSDGSILRSWISEEDVDRYFQIVKDYPSAAIPRTKLKTRIDVINYLIELNGYHSYLEIGCETNSTFNRVNAPNAVGVDPVRGGTLRLPSDAFFAFNQQTFDLVFVDGLHLQEQVLRDVSNSARSLNPGGCILIHDCLPCRREQQLEKPRRGVGGWTGDVWKAVVQLRTDPKFDIGVLNSDWGIAALFVRPNTDQITLPSNLDWESFQKNKQQWLRIMDADTFQTFLQGE